MASTLNVVLQERGMTEAEPPARLAQHQALQVVLSRRRPSKLAFVRQDIFEIQPVDHATPVAKAHTKLMWVTPLVIIVWKTVLHPKLEVLFQRPVLVTLGMGGMACAVCCVRWEVKSLFWGTYLASLVLYIVHYNQESSTMKQSVAAMSGTLALAQLPVSRVLQENIKTQFQMRRVRGVGQVRLRRLLPLTSLPVNARTIFWQTHTLAAQICPADNVFERRTAHLDLCDALV
jgi:hypothetical protein